MIIIEYVPYVGLIHGGTKFVRTKIKDGKLHFFQIGDNVHCDELSSESIDNIVADNISGIKYLGYVELKNENATSK